jgi:hypothetical protein
MKKINIERMQDYKLIFYGRKPFELNEKIIYI